MIQNQLYRLRIALSLGAIFLCTLLSFAQNDWLELLPGAEKLSYDEKTGIQRLVGNLNFTYQGNTMYCDSAHYKSITKEVWAYGKVHLNKRDTLNLFCDSLYYNGNTKQAKLWGNVRVRDREYKITTDTLEYDTKNSKATYRYGGKIENTVQQEVLTSRFGYFYPDTEESFFSGKVRYKSPELEMKTDTLKYDYLTHRVYFFGPTDILQDSTKLYCEKGYYNVQTQEGVLQQNAIIDQNPRIIHGDSLYYNSVTKIAIGRGNISVLDTAQKIELNGNYLYANDSLKKDLITENPWARIMKSKDTLYLRADTLFHYRDTANKTMRISGQQNVRFFQNKLQGKADTLDYNKTQGTMDLIGSPYFWSNNSELRGDSMRVFVKDDTLIEKVHLRFNAFAVSQVDSGKYYNQMAGKEIWAYFTKNELVKAEVLANARTVYFPTDTIKTDTSTIIQRQGMNRVFASDFKVYLDSGEILGITFLKQPEGIFFPMDQIDPTEQYLQGFSWNPAMRPKSPKEIIEFIPVSKE